MTSFRRPDFVDSPFFVDEPGNWHLKPGAPADVVKEFNEFLEVMSLAEAPGEPITIKETDLT